MVTDPGCIRDHNEDSIAVVRPGGNYPLQKGALAIVADGMGGHQAGEYASRLAVDAISQCYYGDTKRLPPEDLAHSLQEANGKIFREAATDSTLHGMGTTATALALRQGKAYFAHVGDSRLYRMREGVIELLTEDHTLLMALLKSGSLTEEQAKYFPDRHVITRALGSHPEVEVMSPEKGIELEIDDRFLLCSDGLHDLVGSEDIREALLGRTAQAACELLVELAKNRGGHDNISVIIVRIGEPAKQDRPAPVTRTDEVGNG
ncbi:MAG: Stp1/IreP family PP2C-type Ser/Thr phosphatase [Syntrophobacteraceae bacterium]|nr:Stp1/IreP family PP2C-type Ser/Thr phosphatase [Syntrophobacteraceae bacterium]